MKTALKALFALSLSVLMAQAPQKFNYQAVARDGLGEPLANQNLTVTFSILDGSPSGTVVFSEQQSKTTNAFGVFNAEIGANSNLSTVNWASGAKYLKVDVASSAFTGTLGTAQLLSVPYALFSNNANTAQNSTLNIPGQTSGSLLYFNGTSWAPLPNGSTSDQVLTWSNNSPSWQDLPQGNVYQAGSGLSLSGNTFLLNLNPTQFQFNSITGGLELNPTFISLLNQGPVEINRLTQTSLVPNGYVLKWNGTSWEPQPESTVNYVAGQGVQIRGVDNEISLRTSPQFFYDLNGVLQLNENQLEITPGQINQSGATNGQVLKWNGASWAPGNDAGGVNYTAGDGIELNFQNEIRLRADENQFTFNSGVLGLNITNKIINPTQIQGGTAQDGQVLTWDNLSQNWVPQDIPDAIINVGDGLEMDADEELNVLVDGSSIIINTSNNSLQVGQIGTGNLGDGSVTTSKLAPNAVTSDKLAMQGTANGQVLKWDGAAWVAGTDDGTSYTAGGGLSLIGNEFSVANLGITNGMLAADAVTNDKIAVNSIDSAKIVNGSVSLNDLHSFGATAGQVLSYNGTNWRPITFTGGTTYTAKGGVVIDASNRIGARVDKVTLDTLGTGATLQIKELGIDSTRLATNSISRSKLQDEVVNGAKLAVNSIDSAKIINGSVSLNDLHSFGATAGQVLSYNGTNWRPINTTNLLSGRDIKVVSGRINLDEVVDSSVFRINAPTGRNFVLQNSLGSNIILDSAGNGKVLIGISPPTVPPVKFLVFGGDVDDEIALINNGSNAASVSLGKTGTVNAGDEVFVIKGGDYGNTGTPTTKISSRATQNWTLTNFGSSLNFGTTPNNSSTVIDRMLIDHNGNVGIGTTAPTHLLHVGGTGKNVRFEGYGGVGARMLYVNANGVVRDTVYPIGGTDLLSGYDIKVVGNRINLDQVIDSVTTINAIGAGLNVNATGSQNVNFNLINGRVNIASSSPTDFALQVTGRIKSNALTEVSDARLKKDVKELENALALVKQMRGVSYKWRKDSLNGRTEIGVIAQEMEKLVPEVVDTDNEGFKSVQYSHLVAYLIEAIKEQQEMIAKQQQEIEQLKSSTDLNQLKSSIEILMQRVAELESVQYKEAKR